LGSIWGKNRLKTLIYQWFWGFKVCAKSVPFLKSKRKKMERFLHKNDKKKVKNFMEKNMADFKSETELEGARDLMFETMAELGKVKLVGLSMVQKRKLIKIQTAQLELVRLMVELSVSVPEPKAVKKPNPKSFKPTQTTTEEATNSTQEETTAVGTEDNTTKFWYTEKPLEASLTHFDTY
jgi:hypothetical protein